MRILLLAALALAGCDGVGSGEQAAASGQRDDGRIDCRISNVGEFERFCTIEQAESEVGRTLIVRKPDGGFRRLLVTDDGRGVVAADGAERARVTIIAGNRIEVQIGDDVFRLPATVRSR